jgi:hypothetical protein
MKLLGSAALSIFAFSVNAETLAIVGSPELAEYRGETCKDYIAQPPPKEDEISLCWRHPLHFRYKIKAVIDGTYSEPSVTFIDFYHYDGFPGYVRIGSALVVLEKDKDIYFLKAITPAFDRPEGWQVCSEWSDDEDQECVLVRAQEFVVR